MKVEIDLETAIKARDAMPRLIRDTLDMIDKAKHEGRQTRELNDILHRERAALADLEDATGFDAFTTNDV